MTQLATRAGVSPATPYNLMGGKSEILRLVVREEFASFAAKLAASPPTGPLARLLEATALVVTHYEADRPFYRGLYRAMNFAGGELNDLMSAEGRALWQDLVRSAVDAEELVEAVSVEPFTDLLLRTIAVTTQAWLAAGWTHQRFALEMDAGIRLFVAGAAAGERRDRLAGEAMAAHAAITRLETGCAP